MSAFTLGIFNKLNDDSNLTGRLNSYWGNPAIFTGDRIPKNAELPYITISGNITGDADDTKTTEGRDIVRDIACWDTESGSSVIVEGIAERVHDLLHRATLTITGHTNWLTEASPPISTPPEEGVIGRIITIRIRTEED